MSEVAAEIETSPFSSSTSVPDATETKKELEVAVELSSYDEVTSKLPFDPDALNSWGI